ncbi:QRFP-like peptide receptor [Exaiptasia diaphana]|uniref:G-protein coupled receptors family 1 profile domain-containing protein n=1 Tax=Exaiptasia diaphana TaxID=2652724 RepID=A0A913XUX2_EXADI|nr:QRFP-like peptide receptor [Exaiptasia diaphana]XP_020910205.1 QRFP-like peptide receptor [Exaiptasia diaphana]
MNNLTFNGSHAVSNCPQVMEMDGEKALKTVAYSCVMFLSFTGNVLVILIVYKNRSMQTTVNFLIVNMAFSDLLQSIIAIPYRILNIVIANGTDRWFVEGIVGEIFCKFVPFLLDISVGVSVLSLVLIAFDRFLGVVYPMRASTISKRMHSCNLALTWVISMGFHSPLFFTFRLVTSLDGITYCTYSWNPMPDPSRSEEIYFLVTSTCLFIFPLLLLISLYSTILIRLKRQKTPGNDSFRNQKRIAKRNRNVLRMVLAVVVIFALCWLPLNTLGYINRYIWVKNSSTPCEAGTYIEWAFFIAYSNSFLTPCLYFLFSENYRQGLKQLFGRRVILIKTSFQTKPRNLYDGRETSASESRAGMSLRGIQSQH